MRNDDSRTNKQLLLRTVLAVLVSVCCVLSVSRAAEHESAESIPTLVELKAEAIRQVQIAARDEDPFLRANAIEAMQSVPDRALPVAQLGIDDEHPAVRFTALVTIGKMRLRELGPASLRLLNDPDPSVRAAAMFAARRCGEEADISEMAEMLASPNPSVRGNVVMLLGMMGDPSALPMIEAQAKVPMSDQRVNKVRRALVHVQFAEAQAMLGDPEAISPLRAAMYSEFGEVRVMAVTMLGRLRDVSVEGGLMAMVERSNQPIELKLAAAEAVSHFGGRATIKLLLEKSGFVMECCRSENPVLRSQAVITLGSLDSARRRVYQELLPSDPPTVWRLFENRAMVGEMARLLEDPHPQVRLSAAAAILRDLQANPQAPARAVAAE